MAANRLYAISVCLRSVISRPKITNPLRWPLGLNKGILITSKTLQLPSGCGIISSC